MKSSTRNDQILSTKCAKHIKQAINLFESKHYKKGVKECNLVLRDHPNNGEAVCLKGINLYQQGQKEEGSKMVKSGLVLNVKSFISWHVFGILHRLKNDYVTAIKGYTNALRLNPENLLVQRDLSILKLQISDFDGFLHESQKLLAVQPANKSFWVSCILATYLNGETELTLKMLDTYIESISIENANKTEYSELLLFKAKILSELLGPQETIKFLDSSKAQIKESELVRKLKLQEMLKMGVDQNIKEEITLMVKEAIEGGEDDFELYSFLCQAYGFDLENGTLNSDEETRTELLKVIKAASPQSLLQKTICLQIVPETAFKENLSEFVQSLRPKFHNFFQAIKPICADPKKKKIVGDHLASIWEQTRLNGAKEADEAVSLLNTAAYVDFLLFDRKYEEAIQTLSDSDHIDSPILLSLKATAAKKLGRFEQSFEIYDSIRKSDLSDKSANVKAVKAALRIDDVAYAKEHLYFFAEPKNQNLDYFRKTQFNWFFKALGDSFVRQRLFARALECFWVVLKYYDDAMHDQLDFHPYCFNRNAFRIYIEMQDSNKAIMADEKFLKAAVAALKCYLELQNEKDASFHMDEAFKLCRQVESKNGDKNPIEFWAQAARVYAVRGKPYLAFRAFKKAEGAAAYTIIKETDPSALIEETAEVLREKLTPAPELQTPLFGRLNRAPPNATAA